MRAHTDKNHAQHRAFLDQVGENTVGHADAVAWFKTLPVWFDVGGLRVVHACWNAAAQRDLTGWLDNENRLTEPGVVELCRRSGVAFTAAEVLLNGPEAHLRGSAPDATTFRPAALGIEDRCHDLPDDPVPAEFAYHDPAPSFLVTTGWPANPASLTLDPRASCLNLGVGKGCFLPAIIC